MSDQALKDLKSIELITTQHIERLRERIKQLEAELKACKEDK